MIFRKKHIIKTNFSTDQVIEKLNSVTENWQRDSSSKLFVGSINENDFQITPVFKSIKNQMRPIFTGKFKVVDGQITVMSDLAKAQKLLFLSLFTLTLPLLFIIYTFQIIPISATALIILSILFVMNVLILKISYTYRLRQSIHFLHEIWTER